MIKLILYIISYGSFLLLLTPRGRLSIISAFAIFVFGTGAAVYKRVRGTNLKKSSSLSVFSCLISVFISACLGYAFYYRWLQAYILLRISSVLHIPHELLLLIGTLLLSVMSAFFICAVLRTVNNISFGSKHSFARSLLDCLIASAVCVAVAQTMIGLKALSMGPLNFAYGCLTVAAVILLLYCLIGKIIPSVCVGTGIFMLLSTINVYVYSFRSRLFDPADIFSAFTAMEVASNYDFYPFPPTLLFGLGIYTLVILTLAALHQGEKHGFNIKTRICALVLCVSCSTSVFFYSRNLVQVNFGFFSALNNGYVLDYVSRFRNLFGQEPDGYSPEAISSLTDSYASDGDVHETDRKKLPNIIVIMDESFSDLSVVGDFSTNTEVMPFISTLRENTVSGYALASVYGGNTANSEYEFLTGNSLAWLSPNSVPYVQYIRSSTYSMVSYLKSAYNYKCVAMHPNIANNWNRPAAYGYLGFDESLFIYDFPSDMDYIRSYASDRSMFDYIIKTHEEHEGEPLFIFGVTMQNHGGYSYDGPDFENSISLTGHEGEFYDVEQYLTLIRETDKAVEQLVTYFQSVDEDVLIVFFGDHQPTMGDSFYETVGSYGNTLDERQKRYEVPFFVWANYDIEEKYVDCTSLNYLSSYVYEAAGLELPPYNRFLRDMEENIPSINANGYYSLENGCYLPFEEAGDEERQWLDAYEALQYNCIFDKKNHSGVFFPTLN